MKKIIILNAFIYLSLLSQSVHASLIQADRIYKRNFVNSKTGTYSKGNVLFVITNIDTAKLKRSDPEARGMINTSSLLKEYCNYSSPVVKSPFESKVSRLLTGRRNSNTKFHLNVNSRILVNRKISRTIYRYVVALDQYAVDSVKKNPSATICYSVESWTKKIKNYLNMSKENGNVDKITEFYSLIGNVELVIANNADEIFCFTNIANYPPLVSVPVTKNKQRYSVSLKDKIYCRQALKKYPAYVPALSQLAKFAFQNKKYYDVIVYSSLCAITGNISDELMKKTISQVERNNKASWREYSQLLEKKKMYKEKSVLIKSKYSIGKAAFNSFGHILPTTNKQGARKHLSRLTKSYNKIAIEELSKKTLEYLTRYPYDNVAWAFLGYLFYSQKSYIDAIVCYNQAIFLNPKKAGHFLLNLSYCYKKMSFTNLAKAAAWGTLINSQANSAEWNLAKKNLIKDLPTGIFKND
jgi:tetratricopeptide (TPR) repeat protein